MNIYVLHHGVLPIYVCAHPCENHFFSNRDTYTRRVEDQYTISLEEDVVEETIGYLLDDIVGFMPGLSVGLAIGSLGGYLFNLRFFTISSKAG